MFFAIILCKKMANEWVGLSIDEMIILNVRSGL